MIHEARLTTERGVTVWRCPCCGRMLGEIDDNRVIIKAGTRYLVILIANDQVQRCPSPRCGAESVLSLWQIA